MNFKTPIGLFRIIAFVEGCSYILIGFTMILKYGYDMPEPNYVVGMIHGLLFMVYIGLLVYVAYFYRWSFTNLLMAFIASIIPFGTFIADRKLFSKQDPELNRDNLSIGQ